MIKVKKKRVSQFDLQSLAALLPGVTCVAVLGLFAAFPAFTAQASNASGTTATSIFSAHRNGVTTRLTRAPYVQWTTTDSAYLVWNTDRPGGSIVEYARDGEDSWRHVIDTTMTRRHVVRLDGLTASAAYRYRVGSNGQLLAQSRLQTARAQGVPFRFAVWGDSGEGTTAQRKVARQIEKNWPNLLLHTGDLIYERGEANLFDARFFDIYRPLLARVPFYGSLGNHDNLTRKGQPFLDNFVLPRNGPPGLTPERNYSFDYGDAHFVALDSNADESTLRRLVVPWLEKDLQASRAIWNIVFFHHPPYSSGVHGDEARIRRVLAPAFSRLKVDVVFNGHDHNYERMKPINGVTYVVTGGGGAGLRRRAAWDKPTAKWWNENRSFTRIDINGRELRGQQVTEDGKIVDNWSLNK